MRDARHDHDGSYGAERSAGSGRWLPAGEIEEGLTPGQLDGRAERVFTHGGCDALAIAMHDATGWPVVAITDSHNVHEGRAGGGSAMHWGVRHPSDAFVDVDGMHDQEEITRSYDGDADDGEAAWGLSTRADAEEWWNEAGRKVSQATAAMFVDAVLGRVSEQAAKPMEDEGS